MSKRQNTMKRIRNDNKAIRFDDQWHVLLWTATYVSVPSMNSKCWALLLQMFILVFISLKFLSPVTPTCFVSPWLISNLMYKILIYLHIIHLLKSSTCFEHYPAHLQEVYVVITYTCSLWYRHSLHRLRKNCSSFLTGAQDNHLQRVTIPEAAYIQLRRRPPEDEHSNARKM